MDPEIIQLRRNLNTFTLAELKKEVIKMKTDKFAVTKMKRNQVVNLILTYHYLFPYLRNKTGSKRDPTKVATQRQRPLTKTPKQSKPVKTGIPPASITITPELLRLINQPN